MLQRRKGSMLATAISMTAVFLTLIVGAAAYLESTTKVSVNNRWRDVADQAARSGLDYVLGWAEQSIDRNTKLPSAWEALDDNDVMDPVSAAHPSGKNAAATSLSNALQVGDMVGQQVGEYVLGRYGAYVVTFKARIQQYQLSENMPRQYRIGVVGRVRKVDSRKNLNIDADEKDSIIAERMVLANVGKEPASRYAALIDIDAVRNWVPGEDVWGPVHINRGYVDDPAYARNNIDLSSNANLVAGVPAKEARSLLRLHVGGSSVGFTAPANKPNHPVFHAPVSMTVIGQNENTDYTNYDPNPGGAVQLDDGTPAAYNPTDTTLEDAIFESLENKGLAAWNGPGPIIRKVPVKLPTSVRGALSVAMGIPVGTSAWDFRGWLNHFDDGVYVPTDSWWENDKRCDATDSCAAVTTLGADGWPTITGNHGGPTGFDYDSAPAGGIYIRGNVEIMRSGVDGRYSYYLFQLGYGGPSIRRCYGVLVDRVDREVWVRAWASGTDLNTITGATTTRAALFPGIDGAGGAAPAIAASPTAYSIRSGSGNVQFAYPASGTARSPFNGVVLVDLSADDPGRHLVNPLVTQVGARPLTGNIFALGDPGQTAQPYANKRLLNGRGAEIFATFEDAGANPAARASKLTIMAAGNIFIQNHLLNASLTTNDLQTGTAIGLGGTFAADILGADIANQPDVNQSRDLLGLVADKQIVVGLYAPSATTREGVGVVIHAAIAALGDPGVDYDTGDPATGDAPEVPASEMSGPPSYRGSFTTEGIMQEFNRTPPMEEQYNVCVANPRTLFYRPAGTDGHTAPHNVDVTTSPFTGFSGYPGNPIYGMYVGNNASGQPLAQQNRNNNPNRQVRGRMIAFGSITQKKRGVIGVSNKSYDKDFRFDKRLLTLAPPIFPSSTNVLVRTVKPFSVNANQAQRATCLPYMGGDMLGNTFPLWFMGQN